MTFVELKNFLYQGRLDPISSWIFRCRKLDASFESICLMTKKYLRLVEIAGWTNVLKCAKINNAK